MSYRTRVEQDLTHWQQAGWVTADGARSIRADLDTRHTRFGLPQVLGLLGGILLCFGAMTFVAANWQTMSKLLRLGMLAAALWGSLGTALVFFRRGQEGFGHAAVLVGAGVFGASIMLIAQMYHIDGHPPDAVLVWGIGAALAGVILRSPPSLVLATLLLALWSGWEMVLGQGVHWAFVPAWLILVAGALTVTRWLPLYHLLAIALAGWALFVSVLWLGPTGWLGIHENLIFRRMLFAGALLAAMFTAARPVIDRLVPVGRAATAYMLMVAFAGLWGLQFGPRAPHGTSLGLWFALALGGLLALNVYALRADNRPVLWLAYTAFSIELVSIYFKTLGTLLDTSLFFVSAGLLVIALAWLAWKLHQRAPVLAGGHP